mgnify:CR=1 FL=1
MRRAETPSQLPALRRRGLPGVRQLVGVLCFGWSLLSVAHDPTEPLIPDTPGLRMGAGLALSWADARHPIPAARLPGVLLTGATADDRNGSDLEHGVLWIGLRPADWLGMQLVAGWHGKESAHIESAWIEARHTVDRGVWNLGLGRDALPTGDVIAAAGEFDLFGLQPLAKRAAFDGKWIDDGVNLRWEGFDRWQLRANLGAWYTSKFPAAPDASWSPMLHLGATRGAWTVDGFVAHVRAPRRGSFITLSENAHSHGAPCCDRSLSEVACFEGRGDLAGVSISWHATTFPVEVSAAAITRRERGELYSINGAARYRGRIHGGWVEMRWQPSDPWEIGIRAERVTAANRLAGSGASLLARDTGLIQDGRAAQRLSGAARWAPLSAVPTLQLAFEVGNERVAGTRNPYAMLRVLWRGDFERGLR